MRHSNADNSNNTQHGLILDGVDQILKSEYNAYEMISKIRAEQAEIIAGQKDQTLILQEILKNGNDAQKQNVRIYVQAENHHRHRDVSVSDTMIEKYSDTQLISYIKQVNDDFDRVLNRQDFVNNPNMQYDVFISVKISVPRPKELPAHVRFNPGKTEDKDVADDFYKELTSRKLKPFFSFRSIEDNSEDDYFKDHILYALLVSKCILVICLDEPGYLDTEWLKKEMAVFDNRSAYRNNKVCYTQMSDQRFNSGCSSYVNTFFADIGIHHDFGTNKNAKKNAIDRVVRFVNNAKSTTPKDKKENPPIHTPPKRQPILPRSHDTDDLKRPLFHYGTYPHNADGKDKTPVEWMVVAHEVNGVRKYVTTDDLSEINEKYRDQYELAQKEYTEGRVLMMSSKILDCYWYDTNDRYNKRDQFYPGFEDKLEKYKTKDDPFGYIGYYKDNEKRCREIWKASDMYKFLNETKNGKSFFDKFYSSLSDAQRDALYEMDNNGKIILLSVEEAKMFFQAIESTDWGYRNQVFTKSKNANYSFTPLACAKGTEYAKKNKDGFALSVLSKNKRSKYIYKTEGYNDIDNTWLQDESFYDKIEGNSFYWLRSPGASGGSASGVNNRGSVRASGLDVDSSRAGVRPAFWLNL